MADKCTVRDGRFIEPCEDLEQNSEVGNPPPGKSRGIWAWMYFNAEHKASRTFFGVKTTHRPKGMLFNFCPWCGERIDAPFAQTPPPLGTDGGTHPLPAQANDGGEHA